MISIIKQLILSLTCLTLLSPFALADRNFFLTFGGGNRPKSNQISLERNIIFFENTLKRLKKEHDNRKTYFADGEGPFKDLQWLSKGDDIPKVNQLLSELFGKGLFYRYRSNQLKHLDGGSHPSHLKNYFKRRRKFKPEQDRLFFYFTGHGGRGTKKESTNTSMYMWNNKVFRMKEFVKELDQVDPDVPVVTVMVQCYSGGFANIIFNDGDPKKGLNHSSRCGFFSTVHNRQAAGCTADINEENYDEYSSYFWASLSGVDRMNQAFKKPDFNNDGRISFAEAHANASIIANNIDIPQKTSDLLLRTYSKLELKDKHKGLSISDSLDTFLVHANAHEVQVIQSISKEFKLNQKQRYIELQKAIQKKVNERSQAKKSEHTHKLTMLKAQRSALMMLTFRWPELENPWLPESKKTIEDDAENIIRFFKDNKQIMSWRQSRIQYENSKAKQLQLDKQWAKLKRLQNVLDYIILRENLPMASDAKTVLAFEKLAELEDKSL